MKHRVFGSVARAMLFCNLRQILRKIVHGSRKLNIRLTQMTDYLISFGTMIRSMR